MSREALAEEAGVPLDWIEAGEQSVLRDELKRMARALDVSVDDPISDEIVP